MRRDVLVRLAALEAAARERPLVMSPADARLLVGAARRVLTNEPFTRAQARAAREHWRRREGRPMDYSWAAQLSEDELWLLAELPTAGEGMHTIMPSCRAEA